MEKRILESGQERWDGVELDSEFSESLFHDVPMSYGDDIQQAFHSNLGSLTVLDRMTGSGYRDIETGYRDTDGKFWLASCGIDVRLSGCKTVGEAIEWVKARANTCRG